MDDSLWIYRIDRYKNSVAVAQFMNFLINYDLNLPKNDT